ncbi:MAG TPA: hypothetical protein VGA30_02195 [Actinomycetota bacterium]
MDDETNQEATPGQPAPAEPSTMRILPEAVWGTPNGGRKALVAEASLQSAPDGARSNLDEWYPESWWAWKRGSGSRTGAGSSTTAEHALSDAPDAVADERPADPAPVQPVETGPEPDEWPLFDQEEHGSLSPAPTLDDEFAFLAPPIALADPDPESPSMDEADDADASGDGTGEDEEPEADAEPEAELAAVAGGDAIAWDAASDQMDVPDQWVFGGSRFGGSRRKRSARTAAEGPKPEGKRSRLRRRHDEPEPSPIFGPEEEGEALVSAGRDGRRQA